VKVFCVLVFICLTAVLLYMVHILVLIARDAPKPVFFVALAKLNQAASQTESNKSNLFKIIAVLFI